MTVPLHIDPDQRFSCSQCGRCCSRWEIAVSEAEVEVLQRRGAGRWFRESADQPEGTERDPFEPLPGFRGLHRIRKRADGACGFLSLEQRCRLHEELGGGNKPLSCRVFPFSFHPTPASVILRTNFACPSVVGNQGELTVAGSSRDNVEQLRDEWFASHRSVTAPRPFVSGRAIDLRSLRVLRESLRTMLDRVDEHGRKDLRSNVIRMAVALEDLSRTRVIKLSSDRFAEYVSLTLPFAASSTQPVASRPPSRVGRMLQHGFLFAVAATRLRIEHRQASRLRIRLAMLRLLAHFHGLAPAFGRVDVRVLKHTRVDINAPDIQPAAYHYLRAAVESLGAGDRPALDDFAVAVSFLNAAGALAVMNASADKPKGLSPHIDRAVFSEALIEAVDLSHVQDGTRLGRVLSRLAGGVEALYLLGS